MIEIPIKPRVLKDEFYYALRISQTQLLLNDAKKIAKFYMTHGYDKKVECRNKFYADILEHLPVKEILPRLYKDIRFLKQKHKDYNYLYQFAVEEGCAEIAYFPILDRDSIPRKIKEIEIYLNRLYENRWRAFNYIKRKPSEPHSILFLAKVNCGCRSFLVSPFTPKEEIEYKINLLKENFFGDYQDNPLDILRLRWRIEQ